MSFYEQHPHFVFLARNHPRIRGVVSTLLGEHPVLFQDMALIKPPLIGSEKPWHQDDAYFTVTPLDSILRGMLTLRIHLDDCDESNGLLRVIPGSHKSGYLNSDAIHEWTQGKREITCIVPRGGILVLRPLLLHASSWARRRVIHLEFATQSLPGGLEWLEA